MRPTPTRPSVLPASPRALLYDALRQTPRRKSAEFAVICLSSAIIKPNAISTTALEFLPGQLATKMPSDLAVSTSMVLKPAPARITRASRPARSISEVTRVLLTTSTSA